MLPHLAGRPPTLVRAPDGPGGRPLLREELPAAPSRLGRHVARLRGRPAAPRAASSTSSPTLVWLANLAALELHTHQWTLDDPEHADRDRDRPRPRRAGDDLDCCRVALDAARHARTARPGARREDVGRQGPAPLGAGASARGATDDETKKFALALGQLHGAARPEARPRRHGEGEAHRARCSSTGARTTGTRRRSCAYSLRLARPADGLDAARRGTRSTTRPSADETR